MAQRVGAQIAELPIKVREKAFAGAERCFRAAGRELGVAGPQLDSIVDLQMKAIRQVVTDIDVKGSPRGGEGRSLMAWFRLTPTATSRPASRHAGAHEMTAGSGSPEGDQSRTIASAQFDPVQSRRV
jgi:hypothetical protein